MWDVIIVGAGPAGLTAAIYLLRANKKVLILEEKSYGGAIINTLNIENYPACPNISGFDFATNLYNQVKKLGGEIKYEKVININNGKNKEIITISNKYTSKAIIIATGTTNRKLDLNEEDAANYMRGLIKVAADNWRTKGYDLIQKIQNNNPTLFFFVSSNSYHLYLFYFYQTIAGII